MTSDMYIPAADSRRPGSANYDVVVVGGRVAGAATALLLARCGHRVLVVDRENAGSDTVSTHTILRLGVLQLKRWGLLDRIVEVGTPPIRRVTLGFGSELVPIDLSDDYGVDALYAPRRTTLDAIVVEAAIEAGAEFLHRTRMVDLLADKQGRARGVLIDNSQGKNEIKARFVVGADGVWSRIASLVGAVTYHNHPVTNSVYYAYYRGVPTDGVYFQFTTGATAGLIPTNDDKTCVYVGWPQREIQGFRTDPEAAFTEQLRRSHPNLASSVGAGERVSSFRGTPGLPGFLRQAGGPGWVLVGDAGYTKDPVSAHGISDALRDAEFCARALDEVLSDQASEEAAIARYQQVRDRLSVPILDQSAQLASYRWDEAGASALMRNIGQSIKDECDEMTSLPSWSAVGNYLTMAS